MSPRKRRYGVFPAMHERGECPRCAQPISRKDLATWDRDGRVVHADCEDPRGDRSR